MDSSNPNDNHNNILGSNLFGYDAKIHPLEYGKPELDGYDDNMSVVSSTLNSVHADEESDEDDNKYKYSTKSSRIMRQRDQLRETVIKDVLDKILPDIEAYKFDDEETMKKKGNQRFKTCTKILKYFACIELDLHDAVLSANIHHVRSSVKKITQGANPQPELLNQFDQNGCTALSLAVKINQPAIVLFLLENGAAVDYIDASTGRTPLFYSVLNKNYEITSYLLASGSNPNTVDFQCISPLMIAANKNDVKHCKMLCAKGTVDIDLQDTHGWSALHHATLGNAPDTVFYLLEEGIDRDLRDQNKRKAIHIAKFKNHGECEFLLSSKARKLM